MALNFGAKQLKVNEKTILILLSNTKHIHIPGFRTSFSEKQIRLQFEQIILTRCIFVCRFFVKIYKKKLNRNPLKNYGNNRCTDFIETVIFEKRLGFLPMTLITLM